MPCPLLSVFLVLAWAASFPSVDAVTTCGGLISIAPSLVRLAPSQLDFSQISLVLTTKSGLRKESVRCAPNGFYIVPIYESGTYVLEPRHPQQWTFSPSRYEFSITPDGQCNDDFNFRIQGFPVHGTVVVPQLDTCSDRHSKAAEVTLTVHSMTNSSFAVVTAYPDARGRFAIAGLSPDDYLIEAQHPRHQITPESVSHTVSWGESNLLPFRMAGPSVSGQIVCPGKIAMGLYLVPRGQPVAECGDRSESCYSVVSDSGSFRFTDVPCGSYTLHVDMPTSAATYAMNVDAVDVEVGFDDVVIAPGTFAIVAVSIVGKVMHQESGRGVDQAAVFVDGHEVAVTDAEGEFMWKGSDLNRKGPYDLKVFKRGHHFAAVRPFYFGDASPLISTEKYDVCGSVQVADSAAPSDYSVEVIVGSSIVETLELDGNGAFCYTAAPGNYEFRPVSSLGSLSPQSRLVTVSNAPVDNVNFYQLTVSMLGFVSCFEKSSCEGVDVFLVNSKLTVSNSTSANGAVVFSELSSGSYRLSASKRNMCFKPVNVEVGNHDISNVMIQQTGVSISVDSPFSVEMDLIDSVKKTQTPVSIPVGVSSLCLPSDVPNRFELQSSLSSPYRFKGEPVTAADSITLQPDRIQVTGKIVVPAKLASSLDIDAASDKETLKTTAVMVSTEDDQATLEYSFWGSVSDTYMISIVGSSNLVFEPNRRQITVSAQEKMYPIEVGLCRGRAGLFRSGKIIPAVPGAMAIANSSEGSLSMVLTNDEYRFGPLSDAADYTIEIQHPEYKFEPISSGDFRSIKLRSIQCSIVDENLGKPIEGVLISLSGAGCRNNTLSDVDGKVKFSGILPGQYYLFPVLKEFVFNPPSLMINLTNDAQTEYTISAKRTLYSVFGSLKSISNNGVSNVIVTATELEGDHLEETVSDATGKYRIRGLSAGARYKITLRSLEITDSIERSVPEERIVTMPAEDVIGIDFVCYRRSLYCDIFGILPNENLPSYIELRHQKTGQLEKAVSCSPSKRFFSFSNIPFGSYVISAVSKDLIIEPILVDVSGYVKVTFKSKPVLKDNLNNTPKISIFTIFIGFALVFAVVNFESLQTSAKKWNEKRKSKTVSVSQSWDIGFERKKNSLTNKSRH